MYIERDLEPRLAEALRGNKVLILYGSRQTGKTTVVEHLLSTPDMRREGVVRLSGDVLPERELLDYATMTAEKAQSILGEAKTLFVDEAQKILDIGLTLKIIHDRFKSLRIVATGSSSFELSEEVGEPLTGRMDAYVLPTLSFPELARSASPVVERNLLETRLLYGSYPDVATAPSDEQRRRRLRNLCSSYLFKDVLKWENLRNSDRLARLAKALSLQLGDEVSWKELGDTAGMDNETAQSYVERLEKAFVVFRLPAFSRNLRNELKKSKKVYFFDTGVRNALIGDFRPLASRTDAGHLFENYLIAERMKNNALRERDVQSFFWRTKGEGSKEAFSEAYPDATWTPVSRDNYVEFVTGLI